MINEKSIIITSDVILRKSIYSVFNGVCFYSGRKIKYKDMHIDHVKPKSKGGKDNILNYVLSCSDINIDKNDKHDGRFINVVTEVVRVLYADKVVSHYNEFHKTKRIYDTGQKRKNISISKSYSDKLIEIGNGNLSHGIRIVCDEFNLK